MSLDRIILIGLFMAGIAGCGSDATGIYPPVLPHSPVNAAWKAVENLEYAYITMDLELVEVTLDPDFFHHLDEEDWADYNGDGIIDEGWGLDLELEWFENLFETADAIDMGFYGDEEYTWEEDSTGQSMALPRTFCVKVWFEIGAPYQGSQCSGNVLYVCRPDSNGEWRIWHKFSLQPLWWPPE